MRPKSGSLDMLHIFVTETRLINQLSMRYKEINVIIQLFNYMLNLGKDVI